MSGVSKPSCPVHGDAKVVSVNCFDHREWTCMARKGDSFCMERLGEAPNVDPPWESMTVGVSDVGRTHR